MLSLDRVFALCEALAQLYVKPLVSVVLCLLNACLLMVSIAIHVPKVFRFHVLSRSMSTLKVNDSEDDRNENRSLLDPESVSIDLRIVSSRRKYNSNSTIQSCPTKVLQTTVVQ